MRKLKPKERTRPIQVTQMQQFIYTGEGRNSFHSVPTFEATSFCSILESSGSPGVVFTCSSAPPANPLEMQIIVGSIESEL